MRLNRSASPADAGTLAYVRDRIFAGSALLLLSVGGCTVEPSASSPLSFTPHCGDEEGDTTCALKAIGKPYCDLCRPASSDQGCAPEPPTVPACRVGGGLATTGADTEDASSSSGEGTTMPTTLDPETTDSVDDSTGEASSSSSSGGPMLPCDSPDGTFDEGCEAEDSGRPYCLEQLCVSCATAGGEAFCGAGDPLLPACSDDTGQCAPCGDVDAFVCGQESPVCDVTGACLSCVAHAECETGACHLDPADPLVGECFLEEEIIYVDENAVCPGDGSEATPNCSLDDALSSVAEDENRLLLVAPGQYDESVELNVDATVAIIGNGGVPSLEGNALDSAGLALTDGRVYTMGIRVSNNGVGDGITCSNATLWMQGSEVGDNADYGIYGTGPCTMRLEASSVFNNQGGGIRVFGGSLVLDNAAVGSNGNGARGPGINAQFATIDILYSTIAGNDGVGPDSLQCLETEGTVRNSIMVGASTASAALDCFPLDFATNAIDSASFAGDGGLHITDSYNALWFNDADGGDFRLGAPPLTPFGDIALWLEGDPPVDADGTERPMDGALGFAGADEPD